MSKKAIVSALALTFVLGVATAGFAAKMECTVDAVDGGKVTMTCKDAGDLKAGDAVEVKAAKAGGAKKKLEGC